MNAEEQLDFEPNHVIPLPGKQLLPARVPSKSDESMRKVKLSVLVLSLLVSALALRLLLVREIVLQSSLLYGDLNAAPQAGFLTADSDLYIRLAKNLVGSYFGQHFEAGAYGALLRTPGYPAFCAPFYSLGLAPGGILITQAVLGALIPILTLWFARILTGSIFFASLAGLLSAISPSGIGLCGLIMSDLLLAVMFGAGICLLYLGAIRSSATWIILAGLVFAGASMVKPILVCWAAVMVPIYYLFCRGENRPAKWKALGMAVVIQLVFLGLWCTRNYAYENVFTLSSASTLNLHGMLKPRVQEWVKAGGLPENHAVGLNRAQTNEMIERRTAGLSTKERLNIQDKESVEVFRAYPLTTLQVVLQNINESLLSGWDYFHRQLPLGTMPIENLAAAARMEASLREKALFLIALFLCCQLILAQLRPTAGNLRTLTLALTLVIVYGYFAALCGMSYWAGPRYLYPVELVMILLFVLTIQAAGDVGRNVLTRAGLYPGEDSPVTGFFRQNSPWLMSAIIMGVGLCGMLEITKKDGSTYTDFGIAAASRGKIAESIPYFQEALQFSTDNPQAKYNLAIAYFELGKYQDAVPLLRDTVLIKPGSADSNYLLGVALSRSGSYQEGMGYIKEALRINPDHKGAINAMNMLIKPSITEPPWQTETPAAPP